MDTAAVSTALSALPTYSAASARLTNETIELGNIIIAPTINNTYTAITSTYTCQSTGPHFFSMSIGVLAGEKAMLQLQQAGDIWPTVQRYSDEYNGTITSSRNILLQCSTGNQVHFIQMQPEGSVTNGPSDYKLTSVVAFPYLPKYVVATSWALYR